jgi:hypothetical protein
MLKYQQDQAHKNSTKKNVTSFPKTKQKHCTQNVCSNHHVNTTYKV